MVTGQCYETDYGMLPCKLLVVANTSKKFGCVSKKVPIGLYREIAIAIQDEVGDSNGGNVYNVTMRITFNIPEFTRNERNSHCDVVHIAPVRVANLVLDVAIAANQTSR